MPSDDPIILEPPPSPETGPADARFEQIPAKAVKWYRRWSTYLASINFAAVIGFYLMIPDRMLDAIPSVVHGLIGLSLLAAGLIPAATSAKQKKPE